MSLRILFQSNCIWVSSGYGTTTRNIANILRRIGHEVGIFASFGLEGGKLSYDGFEIFPRGNDIWGNDIVWSHVKAFGADILITNIDTHVLRNYGNSYKPWIPIVPVMEDPLAPATAGSLNGAFSLVSISEYGKTVLQDKGYTSTMIPLPVDVGAFFPTDKREAKRAIGGAIGIPEDCYFLLNVGMNRGDRKGHDLLLRAFQMILSEIPNAYLYIHTDVGQPDGQRLDNMRDKLGLQDRVKFPSRYDVFMGQSHSWMQTLYNAADVYIQPSRNEGQGMPVYEAAACGDIIIATECTALTEFIVRAQGIGLPIINKRPTASEAWTYDTSAEAVASAVIEARSKWGIGYCSAINRQLATEKVSLPVIGFQWQDFLLNIEKKVRYAPFVRPFVGKIPKVAMVFTQVNNCGVGQYTRMLNASIGEATDVIPVDILSLDPKAVGDADIVHVQHEPSISPKNLEGSMREWKNEGQRVVVTYHNIDPNLVSHHLNDQLVDLALIHWPPIGHEIPKDPRIKILGGMGCPVFDPPKWDTRVEMRKIFSLKPESRVISTFGFASVGRGHFEVPEEMVAYLVANSDVEMQIITPGNFLNDLGLQIVYQNLIDLATRYNLRDRIHLLTDFMPDREVLQRLWCSDVGYLYLGVNTMSSSSAIRFFISARLPTVITPTTHFTDVKRGIVCTDGFGLAEFCQVIIGLLNDSEKRNRLAREHQYTYEHWKWPAFGERILAIYKECLGR